MPYELRSTDGRIVVPIDDSEAYQLAGAIDRLNEMEEMYYDDPDENKEQQAIYDAVFSLFVKLRDTNLGGYFRPNEFQADDQTTRICKCCGERFTIENSGADNDKEYCSHGCEILADSR
jgi:hypothetical protein